MLETALPMLALETARRRLARLRTDLGNQKRALAGHSRVSLSRYGSCGRTEAGGYGSEHHLYLAGRVITDSPPGKGPLAHFLARALVLLKLGVPSPDLLNARVIHPAGLIRTYVRT